MDVGLNNRNTLGDVRQEFKDVVFLVEATRTEQWNLWQHWSKDTINFIEPMDDKQIESITDIQLRKRLEHINHKLKESAQIRVDWDSVGAGFGITIGHINKRPILIDFSFAFINGHKVCFYEGCSQLVDHKMIEDWFITRFQLTHDGYTRWNHTDAGNFHICVHALDDLDKEPRDTVYKIED